MYIGARNQARSHERTREKSKKLAQKHRMYIRHASTYNRCHQPNLKIPEPTLTAVLGMDMSDPFWPRGELGGADEDWASDPCTQEGIISFRVQQSSCEELRRVAREVRQLLAWAIEHRERLTALQRRASEGEALLLDEHAAV